MKKEWDEITDHSRNSTFLFRRDYMDYHADRFEDHSFIAYRKGKPLAILPANISGTTLHSHQGLTYGGWALPERGLDTTEIFGMWKAWLETCGEVGIERIIYKPLPYIYAQMPSEEDRYMLFLSNAKLIRCDISTTIDLRANPGFNTLQKRHLKKASAGIYHLFHDGSEEAGIREFHSLLTKCLYQRHKVAPVHTLEELTGLINRFRNNIAIWGAYDDNTNELLAATCVYETKTTVHCQYIASSENGRNRNALTYLFNELIEIYKILSRKKDLRYFDFGISNEGEGLKLNPGLNRQKTSYGGSGVAYQRYEISVEEALRTMPATLWPEK